MFPILGLLLILGIAGFDTGAISKDGYDASKWTNSEQNVCGKLNACDEEKKD